MAMEGGGGRMQPREQGVAKGCSSCANTENEKKEEDRDREERPPVTT